MRDHPLSPISPDHAERAYGTLTSAFAADPVARWVFPDDDEHTHDFSAFEAALSDIAFSKATAWQLDDFSSVSLWLPPGTEPDAERIGVMLANTVAADKQDDMFRVLEQMDVAHPKYPHWYLASIGTIAERQGSGVGGQLLEMCLDYIDQSGLPSYLENPNPRTIGFFERYGFVVTGEAQWGACPPLALMLREGSTGAAG